MLARRRHGSVAAHPGGARAAAASRPRPRGFRAHLGLSSLLSCLLLAAVGPAAVAGQSAPPATGTVRAGLLLRQMDGVKRVLVIGAHPDDEDTSLLAALARGRGARAAYLSLTRGEGGQNLVGPELGEALGFVRTGELLAARALDGAEQYFTRAYDFGYSKSAEETFRHWPRDSLLADVVWVVRLFRPQVIVSVFSGTALDGHGQHQVAGLLARAAFDAAGDPAHFPDQLARGVRPWTPLKLYRRTFRDPGSASLAFPTGELDPLLGRSHHQLAMESRSQHRSQDFGTARHPGPRVSRLLLLERRAGAGPDTSLFAGVDTSLVSVAAGLPEDRRARVAAAIAEYRGEVRAAREALGALSPGAAVPPLARALEAVRRAAAGAAAAGEAGAEAESELREKERIAGEALLAAASVTLVLRADDALVVPGQRVAVTAELWNGGERAVTVRRMALDPPDGWPVEEAEPEPEPRWPFGSEPPDEEAEEEEGRGEAPRPVVRAGASEAARAAARPEPSELAPGRLHRRGFAVRVADDAPPSRPYYLQAERVGDLYRWPDAPSLWALSRDPPLLTGTAALEIRVESRSVEIRIERPVRFRGVDKATGEFWRPVLVTPRLSVETEPRALIWPIGTDVDRHLRVAVRSAAPAATGSLRLETGEAWDARPVPPASPDFRLEGEGASRDISFRLHPRATDRPARGEHTIRAVVLADGRRYDQGFDVVDHPHIDPWIHLREATSTVRAFPVQVNRGRRVAYVMGSGDDVPQAVRQLGLPIEPLDPARVEAGAFDEFDVVVLGIRAYETRPDLRRANDRLLDWVRAGGTLIVQYNKYEYLEGGYAPYPVDMARPHDRVTDEAAPVVLLAPDAPAFRTPNRIEPADFDGWVQERGLYFLSEWAPAFVPLLETTDPGEEPKRGALLVAPVGEGVYVYTGLAFFRQLPAGVPGAYRLLANLLSATPAEWRAWLEGGEGTAARGPARSGAAGR